MEVTPGFSTSIRVVRSKSGQWEVVEDGCRHALGAFDAPQAALSFACSVAEAKNGSLVVVFDQPRARRFAQHPVYARQATAMMAAQQG